ncbi:hypothetical protein GPECTOR_57g450 [Gonium pectorale]|uniref:Uncharacterized protein n=1 Tax=Gonium pectorale TaxID=33097 RepID=A0A150G743_GONPE|nr:hypothetical protein GPECTOR_57g450 [Gonium pectorale]|eukprot:KXZ45160.1 hypothetical protein GPECTOR_57g450 [Gonium pectorale]
MQPAVAERLHASAALLIASVAMEEFVRLHCTKARLASEHQSRMACHDAAAQSGAAGATTAAAGDPRDGGAGDEAEEDAEMLAFLKSSTPEQVAERLLVVLREPESNLSSLANFVRKHDAESLLAILRRTLRAYA